MDSNGTTAPSVRAVSSTQIQPLIGTTLLSIFAQERSIGAADSRSAGVQIDGRARSLADDRKDGADRGQRAHDREAGDAACCRRSGEGPTSQQQTHAQEQRDAREE